MPVSCQPKQFILVKLTTFQAELGLHQVGSKHAYVESLYCGHLGDLVKCPVYSGTPLLWGPGEVSCIQWNPSIVDTLGTW